MPAGPASASVNTPPPGNRPAIPFGTAGRPFSYSTLIGDLNADGVADVVVADRTMAFSGAAGYRLEFTISGQTHTVAATVASRNEEIGRAHV